SSASEFAHGGAAHCQQHPEHPTRSWAASIISRLAFTHNDPTILRVRTFAQLAKTVVVRTWPFLAGGAGRPGAPAPPARAAAALPDRRPPTRAAHLSSSVAGTDRNFRHA